MNFTALLGGLKWSLALSLLTAVYVDTRYFAFDVHLLKACLIKLKFN